MHTFALRLHPGDDLRLALERSTVELGLRAACIVTCVGSLARARLRLASLAARAEPAVLELAGPLEIVALVGTLSPDGPHLHVALADGEGRAFGGHLLEGCPIQTTAEVVLGELEDVSFAREVDRATGWRELVVRPRS